MESGLPTSRADIRQGDQFIFLGNRANDDGPEQELRVITVFGVSVTGSLSIKIYIPDYGPPKEPGSDIHSIPYSEALLLIEQDIWYPLERARKLHGIQFEWPLKG